MTTDASRRVRVLHGYSGNLYGGVETLLATLAHHRGLSPELDHEFALCYEGRIADELRAAGVTVHSLGPVRFGRPWTVLRARRALRRVMGRSGPDIVVTHGSWAHALFAPVARRTGKRVAFWMHDFAGGVHWADRLASRTPPDLAIINSRSTAETLPRLFPGMRHEVVFYPVAPPEGLDRSAVRARLRAVMGVGEGEMVIVQTSRLQAWKGQSLLIAALGRLRNRLGWVAWIAGGPQRPEEADYLRRLETEAAALGLAHRVRFIGQRSDVPELLAAADVHCQPNLGPEPFGIAFVEALQAGLPVVSTRIGGAAEIVTDACGILTPPDDPSALAEALASLLDSPNLRARLGAAGPLRAKELCDSASTMARLQTLLTGLVRA